MLTTTESLLRAILEDPASDDARLVYADALEDVGEGERAEFIRVQVELAKTNIYAEDWVYSRKSMHRAIELTERSNELTRADWFGLELFRHCHRWAFTRGFVASIALPCAAFLEHAGEIFRSQPVERVTLTDRQPMLTNFTGWHAWTALATYQNFDSPISVEDTGLPFVIPDELFSLLGGRKMPELRRSWYTSEDALAALSHACITYGRSLANLPPLTPSGT